VLVDHEGLGEPAAAVGWSIDPGNTAVAEWVTVINGVGWKQYAFAHYGDCARACGYQAAELVVQFGIADTQSAAVFVGRLEVVDMAAIFRM